MQSNYDLPHQPSSLQWISVENIPLDEVSLRIINGFPGRKIRLPGPLVVRMPRGIVLGNDRLLVIRRLELFFIVCMIMMFMF